MKEPPSETRWIILATDGRHVTIGRHTDPTPEEISRAEAALASSGLAGWLAVLKGGYYRQRKPSLLMVRPLGNPACQWAEAVEAFEAARMATVAASGEVAPFW